MNLGFCLIDIFPFFFKQEDEIPHLPFINQGEKSPIPLKKNGFHIANKKEYVKK